MGYGSVCSPGVELFPTMSKALALIPSTVNVKEDKLNFIYIHIHTHIYVPGVHTFNASTWEARRMDL